MVTMDNRHPGWSQALAYVIDQSHTTTGDDLPDLLRQAAGRVGMTAEMYLADLGQRMLSPLRRTEPEACTVDGTLAGRAFQLVEIVVATGPNGGTVLWVPLLDGTERLGVVQFGLPAGADPHDTELRRHCRLLAGLMGNLTMTKAAYGDALHVARRMTPLSMDAELLWKLLPPLTVATKHLVITAALEPHCRLGGDAFDYSVDDDVAFFAVFDGVGHDMQAGLTTAVALAAIRNSRRSGDHDLTSLAHVADRALIDEAPGYRFVTAVLARLDTRSGQLSHLVAGHPAPLLLRSNKTVKSLQHGPRVPLGVTGRDVGVGHEQLEPGDRLLLYTDGVVEARDEFGQAFGTDKLKDLAERNSADGLPAPESLRRLSHAVQAHQGQRLQDDATLLMVDWSARGPDMLPSATS